MLFIVIISVLIRFSFGDQCPSSAYCTCSSDLTIVICTNRQLTDESLIKLNSQLPQRITVLNLSSNSLTSIDSLSNLYHLQILDLSYNKIQSLPLNFFSKFPQISSLYLRNNSLKTIPKTFKAISNINLDLSNNPLNCTCQLKWILKWFKTIHLLNNLICQNNKQLNKNDFCRIENEQFILNRSISLTVLKTPVNHFCQSIQMNTSKGYFYWSRTLINKKVGTKCPYGSAAWLMNSNEYARAWHTCSSNGQWIDFNLSQCAFRTNISRIFDRLSLNETNLLLKLDKYLSKINLNLMKFDDIILLIDLIDDQYEKYKTDNQMMLIYHLTDIILQIKHDMTVFYKYRMALARLRFILERLLNLKDQSWLYIGKELTAMTIKSPLPSTICHVPNRSLLTITCEIDNKHHESHLATIQFPSNSHVKDNQPSLFRIIFYRQSTLFPSDGNMSTNNPAIYIQPVSPDNLSTIKLTFYNQLNQASIRIRHSNQTSWQIPSSACEINKQNDDLISTNCILLNNNSFSVTYFNSHIENKILVFHQNYSQLTVYVSSIIASICLFICILFYVCSDKIYSMPRCFYHCLVNYWLSLAILFPLFAFGIRLNQYPFLCSFTAICLHYLCLTTILWLTLLTYSIWRKLNVLWISKDHHENTSTMINDCVDHGLSTVKSKSKPVIQFYFLAYGIAFIICSINVAISREQYIANKICFLNDFESLLTLFIPTVICILFIFLFLLAACINLKRLTNETIHSPDMSAINEENILSSKANETLLNLNRHQSYFNSLYSSDLDHQHQPLNQLLSILFQLILLIILFLSSFAIYLHPLHSFNLRFEHIIYSHLYGFLILLFAFYILSFYVLSRADLITHCYFHKKNNDNHLSSPPSIHSMINKENNDLLVEQQSYSHHSLNMHARRESQNDIYIYGSKRQTDMTSKYYATLKIYDKSLHQNNLSNSFPFSSLHTLVQENSNEQRAQRNSMYERAPKRLINTSTASHTIQNANTQFHLPSIHPSRLYIRPQISSSQAIIRSIPITYLSLPNAYKNRSNLTQTNKDNQLIEQNSSKEKLSVSKKSTNGDPPHVAYIDEDDECSVSLQSSISHSKLSSSTTSPTLTKNDRSRSLSFSSSNDFSQTTVNTKHKIRQESSV